MVAEKVVKEKIASIILAGGESRRMGRPKLSLKLKGKTLLELAISKARNVSNEVFVIVGAYPEVYEPIAKKAGAQVLQNSEWQEGLGTTLRTGIEALGARYTSVLALLADQPFVDETHLNALLNKQLEAGADLVFSSYDNVQGPPVVISQSLFTYAKTLKGKCGAKALIQADTRVESVGLEHYFDIDTPEDAQMYGLTE